MAKAMKNEKYGEWAFLLGVVLALIVGLFSAQLAEYKVYLVGVLAVLGVIVGLLNIREKETNTFLLAGIALLMVSSAWMPITTLLETALGEQVAFVSVWLTDFFAALVAFVSPAVLIIAIKAVYDLATKQ